MKYLLDTNICIYIINNNPKIVLNKFKKHDVGDIVLSTITKHELLYAAYKSKYIKKNIEAINQFCSPFEILAFDEKEADICGRIRADLEVQGNIIGAMDLQIAAIAMSYDFTLVTNNEKEFNRIKGLNIENWV